MPQRKSIYDISKQLPQSTKYKGNIYALKLYFNRVLTFFELFNNENLLSDEDKYDIGFTWFTGCKKSKLSAFEKAEFITLIIKHYLTFQKRGGKEHSQSIVNFTQDSGYIYASFRAEYGVNLLEEHDKLHWWEFRSLFDGLSEDSIIKKIMSIRASEIPASTQYNSELIAQLIEQKAYYALEISEEEKEKNIADGWAKLFAVMEQRAQ